MTRLTTSAILTAALFAGTLAFSQTPPENPAATTADPYQSDPANGGTKPTPANEGNTVPVAAPPNAAADAKAEAPKRTPRIGGGVMAGLILTKKNPVYPAEAKKKHLSGTVVLRAIIGIDGTVHNLTVVSGDPILADAAINAVKVWTYRPYLLNGQPTEVETTIMINFNLAGG